MASFYRYQGDLLSSYLPLYALPELPTADVRPSLPALSVIQGRSPMDADLRVDDRGWLLGDQGFGFDLPDLGRFTICGGSQIYLDLLPGVESTHVEQVLLGTAFAVAQMQRRRFCLHAAVLTRGGRTIAFCGDSGEGKSTMALTLSLSGWQVLTDDLALVEVGVGSAMVRNNGRHLRLWTESLSALGLSTAGLKQISTAEEKFFLPAPSVADTDGEPLDAICFLQSDSASADFDLSPISGMPALALLRRHTYRSELLGLLGCDGAHLKHCCELGASVPLFRFTRPRDLSRLAEMAAFISQRLGAEGLR